MVQLKTCFDGSDKQRVRNAMRWNSDSHGIFVDINLSIPIGVSMPKPLPATVNALVDARPEPHQKSFAKDVFDVANLDESFNSHTDSYNTPRASLTSPTFSFLIPSTGHVSPKGYRMRFDDDSLLAPVNPTKLLKGAGVRAEAARLKAVGVPVEDIAEQFGWFDPDGTPDVNRVFTAIRTHLASLYRFTADEAKILELESLDQVEYRLWNLLKDEHVVISQGRIVRDENGDPVPDSRFALETMDRILKVKDMRAKMMGTYAPKQVEVISIDRIEQEISKLEQQLLQAELPAPTAPSAPPLSTPALPPGTVSS